VITDKGEVIYSATRAYSGHGGRVPYILGCGTSKYLRISQACRTWKSPLQFMGNKKPEKSG
jgi:hypothetical protein